MSKKLILPSSERSTLEELFRHADKPYLRNRAQAILLRADGFAVSELAKIYHTRSHTIYAWLNSYAKEAFIGLKIKKGRGAKSAMNELEESQIDLIKTEIENDPQSLRSVSASLSKKLGFAISKKMLKNFLKKT